MPNNSKRVDEAEVNQFESQAAHWWDAEGPFKPLHGINPVRLNYIKQHVALKGQPTLDVGCGGGLLSEALAREGAQVTGIDAGKTAIETAQLHLHESGLKIRYQVSDSQSLARREAGQYNVVCCMELLEHVPDAKALIADCSQLTAAGGQLFFSTINRSLRSWLFAILGAEYVLRLLPQGTHQYSRLIRPSELAMAAESFGLEVRAMSGLFYNPLTAAAGTSRCVDINYIMCLHKP